ncbi:sialate O-acetylesterase [Phenylobacterium sp.]|uniref:sialate O-acetylesterase n=1 Tax=Phenylobacterium sp. TaxID=1871053 RepID=UPI0039630ACD
MRNAGVAVAGVLLCAACSPRPTADLVIVAGQSNALGYGLSGQDLPADIGPDAQVRIWDGARFAVMAPGRNTGSPNFPASWGPEAGFAHAWRAAHPDRPLYIVKYARGSTPLAPSPGRDWAPESGELFQETEEAVAAARAALEAQGLHPRIAAVLWMQGEADATDPARAGAYRSNLTALLAAIRERWAKADTPVVVGRIPDFGARAGEVRAAQAAVDAADPRTATVDAKGLPMQPDGLHIAAAGQLRLGEAMAQAAGSLSR